MSPGMARLMVVGAAALFSTGGAAIKATSLTGWQVAGLRSLVAAIVLLALIPAARPGPGGRGWNRAVGLVALAYAATLTLFVTANKLTTAVNTIFLQSTSPIYIVLLSPWLLGERVTRRDLAVMAVLGVGMALILGSTELATVIATDPTLGNSLAAASGLAWALAIVGLRQVGRDQGSGAGAAAAAAGNVLTTLVCLPFMLPFGEVHGVDVAVILWLGLFQIGAAYALLTRAMPHLPALQASLLLFVEPVLSGMWAWVVHHEVPSTGTLAGGVVILGGLGLQAAMLRHPAEAADAVAG